MKSPLEPAPDRLPEADRQNFLCWVEQFYPNHRSRIQGSHCESWRWAVAERALFTEEWNDCRDYFRSEGIKRRSWLLTFKNQFKRCMDRQKASQYDFRAKYLPPVNEMPQQAGARDGAMSLGSGLRLVR